MAPLLVYIYPPAGSTKTLKIKIQLDKPLNELQDGEALTISAPKDSAFVMADAGGGSGNSVGDPAFKGFIVNAAGKATALAITCSHLGCSVALNKEARRFDCPCHGSQFSLTGTVLHGPAVAPLSHLRWTPGSAPDQIIVDGISLPGLG